eukprot:TRINITY_DN16571_c0_g1_i1.p1 TRINITY_DN16571_c0_g1~~TRINITY_DN16571_c0_g1_i1.p1  ORF type:complete len:442 (+),score=128.77 TRINITY_DN16571_c0_g1_i1:105-1430(+)
MPTKQQREELRERIAALYESNLQGRLREDPSHRALHSAGRQIIDPEAGVPLIERLISGGYFNDTRHPWTTAEETTRWEDAGIKRGRGRSRPPEEYVRNVKETRKRQASMPGREHKMLAGSTFPVGWCITNKDRNAQPDAGAPAPSPPSEQGLSSAPSAPSGARLRSGSAPPAPPTASPAAEGKPLLTPTYVHIHPHPRMLEPPPAEERRGPVYTAPAKEGTHLWQRRMLASPPPADLRSAATEPVPAAPAASAPSVRSAPVAPVLVAIQCTPQSAPGAERGAPPSAERAQSAAGPPPTHTAALDPVLRPASAVVLDAAARRRDSAKWAAPRQQVGPRCAAPSASRCAAAARRGGSAYTPVLGPSPAAATRGRDAIVLTLEEHDRLRDYSRPAPPPSPGAPVDWTARRVAQQRSNSAPPPQAPECRNRRHMSRPQDTAWLLR